MSQPQGFYLPLSLPRRIMSDLLYFAQKSPTTAERRMNLADVMDARDRALPRPSWCALFTKAWALTCAAHPALRRAYFGFPYPRLYQHPGSVASIAVERPYGDENAVFFLHISEPQRHSLTEIDGRIKWFKDRPLGSSGIMRRQLRIARLPLPLRRLAWWFGLNYSGSLRARMLGTYGVNSISGLGAESLHPPCVATSTLSYGVVEQNGDVVVRVSYDYRVLDGADVARALASLESFLKHELLAELRYLESLDEIRHAA